jgi:sucrose-6-phosphate hydrolase SacC (GH32 family)
MMVLLAAMVSAAVSVTARSPRAMVVGASPPPSSDGGGAAAAAGFTAAAAASPTTAAKKEAVVVTAVTDWCPKYHLVNGPSGADIYDPSGPIKVGDTWHVFADGTSVHWESTDLLRWRSTRPGWFSGLTGAITRTGAGFTAIYVDKNFPGNVSCGSDSVCMQRRFSTDVSLANWSGVLPLTHPGKGCGGMDPGQAMLWRNSSEAVDRLRTTWRVPTLASCGTIGWLRAIDDRLTGFDGYIHAFNETSLAGHLNTGNGAWVQEPHDMCAHGQHFECPDIFNIGQRTIVFASVAMSNSNWWLGDLNHTSRIPFVNARSKKLGPVGWAATGPLDYGEYYSAKHGSDSLLTNSSRNLVFGVAGLMLGPNNHGALMAPEWMQVCKRYHTIPRDISIDEKNELLQILPIPELASLRDSSFRNITNITQLTQVGSQLEAVLTCTAVLGQQQSSSAGAFGLDVLVTASAREYTRLGVNMSAQPTAFVDTSHTAGEARNISECSNPGSNVVPLWQLHSDNIESGSAGFSIVVTALVDGGMIEAFFGNQCPVTTLVQPSTVAGPDARYIRPFNTAAGVNCDLRVSKLLSLTSGNACSRSRCKVL